MNNHDRIYNKIITPEVILQKLSDRLRSKWEEVEYLVYADKRFEKWLQCELALSMSDNVVPRVFDEHFKEIRFDFANSNEKICDLTIEYSVEGDENEMRSDVFIAESPFVLKYADEDTWQILNHDDIDKCKRDYNRSKFHYIELKQMNWVDIKNVNPIASRIINDLTKYSEEDWRTFKAAYHPSSIISICCVAFWDEENARIDMKRDETIRVIDDVRKRVTEVCNTKYSQEGIFLWQQITEEIYLLMLYYNVEN